ncbi:Phenylalanine--tRNA ligase beta subunit [Bienertia sinuspersici]
MYGGGHKFSRGGGGGQRGGSHNKRNSFPPPPQWPSSNKPPSISSSRNKPSSSSSIVTPSTVSPQSEESFSLISADPPAFAAIIRLAPDLVDEIKRAESLSLPPQIKFHSNPNNTSGNVIDVGGKEFRFTWSHEMGGLCDIYEERQNGEDGNGLLVESGCSWRKLNVQRVLDESTKKHVKKRSEEYEQKLKSRKAIVWTSAILL